LAPFSLGGCRAVIGLVPRASLIGYDYLIVALLASAASIRENLCLPIIIHKIQNLSNLALSQSLSGKTLKEKDAIIDLVCNLCRLHQQSGFTAALKLAHRLSHELNT
jgi:hypothetical protein